MKMIFITGLLCISMATNLHAQERFWENTFATFGIGTQLYLGDSDKHMDLKDRLTPAFDFSVGKWFTPGIGAALSYTGYKIKGVWSSHLSHSNFSTDIYFSESDNGFSLYEQRASFFNVHLDALFDIGSLLKWRKQRVYHLIPFAGIGWGHSYKHRGKEANSVTLNGGLINSFKVSSRIDLNITLRGVLLREGFDGEGGKHDKIKPELNMGDCGGGNVNADALSGVTVGITYHFH